MTDSELLRAAIDQSGLSARAFAKIVVTQGVNERTVRRWLRGDNPIPPEVLKQAAKLKPKTPD